MRPLDQTLEHVRGPSTARLLIEYGDYECPYSRLAFREIERLERLRGDVVRFSFRHFPLTDIHPHALAAAAAAEAASLQGKFWQMHELLFHRQQALEDADLRRYAGEIALDVAAFDVARASTPVSERIDRDIESAIASGEVLGTPTLFIDGVVYRGSYDSEALLEALQGAPSGPARPRPPDQVADER